MNKLVPLSMAAASVLSWAVGGWSEVAQPRVIEGAKVALVEPDEPPLFQSPVRIAADGSGVVYVGDGERRTVVALQTPALYPIRQFTTLGEVGGLVAANGRVYVGNTTLGRIDVHDALGNFLFVLGGLGVSIGDATEIEVDLSQNLLFAVDASAKTVWVFSLTGTGTLVRAISGPGLTRPQFQHPTGLALNRSTQEVFVADFGSVDDGVGPRVIIFGYDGAYRGVVWGSGGAQGYYFSKPQGLAVGESGHIFVVDAWLGRVVVMDRVTSEPAATLGQFGAGPGGLLLPLDLVIDGPGRDLYVVSNQSKSIVRFAEGGLR